MPPKRKPRSTSKKNSAGVKIKMAENREVECKFCGQVFHSKRRMKTHLQKCLFQKKGILNISKEEFDKMAKPEKSQYTCKICNKKFKFKNSYKLHNAKEHSNLPNSLQCEHCIAKCPDKKAMAMHIERSHKSFKCPHCPATFSRNYHVLRHMKQKGCDGKPSKSLPCKICGSVYSRKDNLMYHLRNTHMKNAKQFSCKQCIYGTDNYNKYVKHHLTLHLGAYFECDLCGKSLGSRIAMVKHLEIHGEKKFECSVCTYKSHTLEVMRRHILSHEKDKPMKCSICSRSFIQIQQLRAHMSIHTGYTCDICDLKFHSRVRLACHLRVHQGLSALLCPHLDCIHKREFATEAAFNEHMKMHECKPFICEICTKPFHNEMSLKRHTVVHTLERPRRCMYCVTARAYVRGERLIRHLRLVHPDVFKEHLMHVRGVLGKIGGVDVITKVKKSEIECILVMLDALQDRVLGETNSGPVLYGGVVEDKNETINNKMEKPLMTEEELTKSLKMLLEQLIDAPTLEAFGWPDENVDVVLEKVIEQCGQRVADRERWARVQCLRENAKHLFLHVIEDSDIKKMLESQTIDQVIRHILNVSI